MRLYEKLEEAGSWGQRLKVINEFFSYEKSSFRKETKLLSIRHLSHLYGIGDKCLQDEPYDSKDYPLYILGIQKNKELLVVDSKEDIYCLKTSEILYI